MVPEDIERLQKDLDESLVIPSQQICVQIKSYGTIYGLEVTVRGSPMKFHVAHIFGVYESRGAKEVDIGVHNSISYLRNSTT
jgi:hypothetical protein